MKGIELARKTTIAIAVISKKMNRSWLSRQVKFLNLSANKGKGDTNKSENTTVIPIRKNEFKSHRLNGAGRNTSAVINKALAGVGTPMNESCCFSSMLNLAKRKAENAANKNETYGSIELVEAAESKVYITIVGNTPKLTMSARESNSLPIGEETLSIRAAKPSKKSNTQASHTQYAANSS